MKNENLTFQKIIEKFQSYQEVVAIGLGGSCANETSDNLSDIDMYIFVEHEIPLSKREFIKEFSSKFEIGGEYFGSSDEFFVDDMNRQLDVMYWNKKWFEDVVQNAWVKHYPSNGYTTAFLFTLQNLEIIFDTKNWLANLQNSIKTPYPKELKENIIKRNMMLMKEKPFASYYEQIEKAVKRGDIVSINHRVSAFLASYFDVIFAVNKLLHPGEKRLIKYAKNNCKILPYDFEENINKLLTSPQYEILGTLDKIYANLEKVLEQ